MLTRKEYLKELSPKERVQEFVGEVLSKIYQDDSVQKDSAYQDYYHGETDEKKIKGAVRVAYSHFMRSLASADSNIYLSKPKLHPTFNEYFCHWLCLEEKLERMPESILKNLRKVFPAPEKPNPNMLQGRSDWY